MNNCIFCAIIAGEKPSHTVYEDDALKAILDIDPVNEGHILILTKHHYTGAEELPEEICLRVYKLARRLAAALKDTYHCDGYTVMQNSGSIEKINHYHLHLIPRYQKDHFFIMSGGEVHDCSEEIAENIRLHLAALPKENG